MDSEKFPRNSQHVIFPTFITCESDFKNISHTRVQGQFCEECQSLLVIHSYQRCIDEFLILKYSRQKILKILCKIVTLCSQQEIAKQSDCMSWTLDK